MPKSKEEVLEEIKELGLYLGGSRKKLGSGSRLIKENTDYDFQAGVHYLDSDTEDLWAPCWEYDDPKIKDYIKSGVWIRNNNGDYDKDDLFEGSYKHRNYPEITIVLRNKLDLYIKVFESLSFHYWSKYLWKSNPHNKNYSQQFTVDWFNNAYKMMERKWEEDMM